MKSILVTFSLILLGVAGCAIHPGGTASKSAEPELASAIVIDQCGTVQSVVFIDVLGGLHPIHSQDLTPTQLSELLSHVPPGRALGVTLCSQPESST